MRHGKKDNHLGRTKEHREAMLSNMASSLIISKRINTTLAKAKELRKFVEPLLTRAKDDTTHSRRTVFGYLQNKESLKELFSVISEKIATRPGGYTRIIKTGFRSGDNAEMCLIELVDFNELLLAEKAETATKTKTRRSRRAGGKSEAPVAAATTAPVVEEVKEAPAASTSEDETSSTSEETTESAE